MKKLNHSEHSDHSVVSRFEAMVLNYANNVAIKDNIVEYTYIELNEKVNQVANCLRQRGVKSGDFVAIYLEPSAHFVLCMLAILKIGAIYVPLDIFAPFTRLHEILTDSKPSLLITSQIYIEQLQYIEVNIELLKHLLLSSASYGKSNLSTLIIAESLCYMMYTSGSTGKPKGVLVSHGAVLNLIDDNALNIMPAETMAQFSNLAFDGSTFDIWTSLLNGATLCVLSQEVRGNYLKLREAVEKYQINALFLPTGYFHQLISSHPDTLDGVSKIMFGGENINPHMIKSFVKYRQEKQLSCCLVNGYGPTEATGYVCRQIINTKSYQESDAFLSSIGQNIKNVTLYIVNEKMELASEGELCISGSSLASGYHGTDINAAKFIKNPFGQEPLYKYLYKTGDKVKRLSTGELIFLGRLDDQVKVGGYRIHLHEIEQQLLKHNAIKLAAVRAEISGGMHKLLVAYLVFESKENIVQADEIRLFLKKTLPSYMLPAKYVMVDDLPLTSIGKVDKRLLDSLEHIDLSFHVDISAENNIEESIKGVWKELLNRQQIDIHKNLFELGANSLLLTESCVRINQILQTALQISDVLANPTIQQLARFIEGDVDISTPYKRTKAASIDVALIGMSCRFPQASNIEEFWENLCSGVDGLTRFENPTKSHQISTRGALKNIEQFDANFFEMSPMDAAITDPQIRIFLECAHEALEHAGVSPRKLKERKISVFSGMLDSSYLTEHIFKNERIRDSIDDLQQRIATNHSMLSTQVSYRLNLKGKSVNVNTACSTGLMAVEQACQDLLLGNSDVALAGASSIVLPQDKSYNYQEGGIFSKDGYCRPFSDKADGTVFSNGVGVVVLKRLEDAVRDRDIIYAVIKGRGINNDGGEKLGFSAPSVSGQAVCISEALNEAQVSPEKIGLVEAHGTATALGDVIELEALRKVYREHTEKVGYCALGSVKANIGHTDVAAGIAGLIKASLCLYYQKIPPLIHFERPNPDLLLDSSPFFINTHLMEWKNDEPQYAAVSSFGVGGTNVHFILQSYSEAKGLNITDEKEELILLSAKSEEALEQTKKQFINYLEKEYVGMQLSDIAHTLQTRREDYYWRMFVVGKNISMIGNNLRHQGVSKVDIDLNHEIVFLFSGQGNQYPQMSLALMEAVPVFAFYMKKGAELAKPYLNQDLIELLRTADKHTLSRTEYTQPVLFIVEYALARLLMDCGIQPAVMLGHSLGEYTAACIAGVFSFEDAISLVCERGLLMATAPHGAMLAVECDVETCLSYLKKIDVDLALHNSNNHCVVSGTIDAINDLECYLQEVGQSCHRLQVSHAFHSRLMDSLESSFKSLFSQITLSAPKFPIVSNVTGEWLTPQQAMSAEYWFQQLRYTVRLHRGIESILQDKHPLFVEIGPGQSMCHFVRDVAQREPDVFSTLPSHNSKMSDLSQLLTALGRLWEKGVSISFDPIFEQNLRRHVALPTYPFQRERYWIEPDDTVPQEVLSKKNKLYAPVWARHAIKLSHLSSYELSSYDWVLLLEKENKIGQLWLRILKKLKLNPIVLEAGNAYVVHDSRHYEIRIDNKDDYHRAMRSIKSMLQQPVFIHTATCELPNKGQLTSDQIETQLGRGFYSVLYWIQAFVMELPDIISMKMFVVSSGIQQVLGQDNINPINAGLIGPCRVIPVEHPNIQLKLIDICLKDSLKIQQETIHHLLFHLSRLWNEIPKIVSYRNHTYWDVVYQPYVPRLTVPDCIKDEGIYLITGGLGGVALQLCEAIAKKVKSPVFILLSRREVPSAALWEELLINKSSPHHTLIAQLQKIKNLGAQLYFYQVDIGKESEVIRVMDLLLKRFKKINGLIHAAGVAGSGITQNKTKLMADKVFFAKVQGTYYLARVLSKYKLDVVVLMSSLAALLDTPGQIDYTAANAVLNAFSESKIFNTEKIVSINWNTWCEVGMAVDAAQHSKVSFLGRGNDISSEEGQNIFFDILSYSSPLLAVSQSDLQSIARQWPCISENLDRIDNKMSQFSITGHEDMIDKLKSLWQEVLGVKRVDINDDFFSLGGHSLNTLQLIKRINETFHCQLLSSQLFTTPTVQTIKEAIIENRLSKNGANQIVVSLKVMDGDSPNLFLCHPISGLIHCFNAFVEQSTLQCSLYGLQDPAIDGKERLYSSLVDMAKSYLYAIKQVQPTGPYYLLGYSFGGNLVHEIACLLNQNGEEVKLLAMLDSWAVHSSLNHDELHFKRQLGSLSEVLPTEIVNLAWEKEKLLLNCTPTKITQNLLLFKAKKLVNEYKSLNEPLNGWDHFNFGDIDCCEVEATHFDILDKKFLELIINKIAEAIERTSSDNDF